MFEGLNCDRISTGDHGSQPAVFKNTRQHAKSVRFYPTAFPSYPELDLSAINEGGTITIRAFFPTSKSATPIIDSGHIDLEVEYVDREAETIFANILTELPAVFALSKGTTIELNIDEVLSVHGR